jgi:uncharacterized membrane protein
MSPLGWVHTSFAVAAIASGAAVLLRRKGTRSHRRLGWVYVASMLTLNGTALLIQRLFGGFGPFHVLALLSLATVAGGVAVALRRRPGWIARHYRWMAGSYVGLLAAAASEAAVRLPGTPFWGAVLLATAAVVGVGVVLIRVRAEAVLAPFGGGRRRAGA